MLRRAPHDSRHYPRPARGTAAASSSTSQSFRTHTTTSVTGAYATPTSPAIPRPNTAIDNRPNPVPSAVSATRRAPRSAANRTTTVNRDDPTVKAQLEAAAEERKQKLDLLGDKSANERMKNQLGLTREQRKAWEEVGTPAEKYAGHLADINEQFEKYHDSALRAAQVRHLDRQTFEDLKRLNPDHEPNVNLYGRTGSYDGLKVGGGGTEIARQQLELMKKSEQRNDQWNRIMQDFWTWLKKQTGGVLPFEIGI